LSTSIIQENLPAEISVSSVTEGKRTVIQVNAKLIVTERENLQPQQQEKKKLKLGVGRGKIDKGDGSYS